ncbi:MAG: hypothetical protein PHH83_05060 [Patescibacteria group bacterium]|nr:hypothetical protein [Patescibacteria group bacterium]
MKKVSFLEYIEDNIIRCEAGYRGGGIEISLDSLLDTDGYKMTAYQNYLGGGLLGSIQNDYNFDPSELSKTDNILLEKITDELNRYFHNLTNHEGDEWEEATFEENQNRPSSAY